MRAEVIKTFTFEAAHANGGGGERTARMHGHSYAVEVSAEAECDEQLAWVVDYGESARHSAPSFSGLIIKC